MVKRIRRTLISFVDTKTVALRIAEQIKKRGATHIVIKKEIGAWGVYGKPSAIMKKQLRAR